MHGRDVDADLLEHAAAHHRHHAAAAVAPSRSAAARACARSGRAARSCERARHSSSSSARTRRRSGRAARRTRRCAALLAVVGSAGHRRPLAGKPAVWRSASASTMRRRERDVERAQAGRIGITSRARRRRAPRRGTPALSRPSSRMSSGAKAKSVYGRARLWWSAGPAAPRGAAAPPESVPGGVAGQVDVVEIVHAGAPQPAVVEEEAAGLDDVDGDAEAGARGAGSRRCSAGCPADRGRGAWRAASRRLAGWQV